MSLLDSLTEAAFQSMIIERARARGWLVHHCRPARTTSGYRTPISGDPGFPDLVLAKNGRALFIEVKTAKGRLSDGQRRWLETLNPFYDTGMTVQFDDELTVYCWRPSDWPQIETILDNYGATP